MPTMPLDDAIAFSLTTESSPSSITHTWPVPDSWHQGRGAFGGLTLAALVRAMDSGVKAQDQKIRSLTATICGPVAAKEATIRVDILREGSSTTAIEARVIQDDEVKTHAVAFYGRTRNPEDTWRTTKAPDMPDWREFTKLPMVPPISPEFTQHFEFRAIKHLPLSGAEACESEGYIKIAEPPALADAAWLTAHMDAWWPSFWAKTPVPRPMATVAFTMQFLTDYEDIDLNVPLRFTAHSPEAHDGYSVEFRELWTLDGRLLATNQQTFTIIK